MSEILNRNEFEGSPSRESEQATEKGMVKPCPVGTHNADACGLVAELCGCSARILDGSSAVEEAGEARDSAALNAAPVLNGTERTDGTEGTPINSIGAQAHGTDGTPINGIGAQARGTTNFEISPVPNTSLGNRLTTPPIGTDAPQSSIGNTPARSQRSNDGASVSKQEGLVIGSFRTGTGQLAIGNLPEGTRAEDVAEAREREVLVVRFLEMTGGDFTEGNEGNEKGPETTEDFGLANGAVGEPPTSVARDRALAEARVSELHETKPDPIERSEVRGRRSEGNGTDETDGTDARGTAPASGSTPYASRGSSALSGNEAARVLGRSPSWFSEMVRRYRREGLAGLLPRRRECGRKASPEAELLTEGDVARIRFILLKSNRASFRSATPGSKAFAVRKYATMPDCPEALRKLIEERYRAGKTVLPPSALNRIQVSRATFGQYRSPKNAALDLLQAPGSSMWMGDFTEGNEGNEAPSGGALDGTEGEQEQEQGARARRRFIRAGEVVEADDASINFCAVVPWEMGGCPCSERHGVKVARFQLLLAIDVGSRKILGYTYVARPKGSYRAEDVVTLQNAVARRHGEPSFWRFERGVWESAKVQRRVRIGGSRLWTVYSPHAKPFVEGVFNKLWTLLSLERGQIGRFRGEMEEENRVLTSCLSGATDPRRYFCTLKEVLEALDGAIAWHNESIIRSERFGEWVPNERWESHQGARPNRRFSTELEWLAAPFEKEWRVRGNTVGGQIRLFDGCSLPFTFGAEWLPNFDGVKVRALFDPMMARCSAMLLLGQDFAGRRTGEVLGTALLIDECASYARLVLEWGDDDRAAGKSASARAQGAMRREVRVVSKDGKMGGSEDGTTSVGAITEIRDGLGRSVKVETGLHSEVGGQEEDFSGLPKRGTHRGESRTESAVESEARGNRLSPATLPVEENTLDFV
jgi:hypothetical protein